MRYWRVAVTAAAAALICVLPATAQQTAEQRLQAGLYQEQVQGNLEQAIGIYEAILREYPGNRGVGARAQLHIGLCYETLGSQSAQRAYQRVIDNYGDQSEEVGQARVHLAALQSTPTATAGPVARRLFSVAEFPELNDFVQMVPSPDGRRVVYVSMETGDLLVRDLASGQVRQVVAGKTGATWYHYPEWSPDGERVALAREDMTTDSMVVMIYDVATGEGTIVPGTGISRAANEWIDVEEWARDGRHLLCDRSPGLELVAIADGTATPLVEDTYAGQGSLSPDGRFITYAKGPAGNEQVFVKPVAGGPARQVTQTPGTNSGPRWSPDGRAIAYERPDGIWLLRVVDGTAQGTPELIHPTDNGKMIKGWTLAGGLYFTLRKETRALYGIPVDATGGPTGQSAQQLPGVTNAVSFDWSPDMKRIAFREPTGGGFQRAFRISIYDTDLKTVATHDNEAGALGPTWLLWWSSDGREVQFPYTERGSGSWNMRALDAATGKIRDMFPRTTAIRATSLSRDGRLMAGFMQDADGKTALGIAETGRADTARPLTSDPWYYMAPQLSPGGDLVHFARPATPDGVRRDVPGAAALMVVGTDGTGRRQVASLQDIWSAAWDPTGRFIAFTGTADSTTAVLRTVDVATGAQHDFPLPDHSAERGAGTGRGSVQVSAWSPDGKLIGIIISDERWEYWVLTGLPDGGR